MSRMSVIVTVGEETKEVTVSPEDTLLDLKRAIANGGPLFRPCRLARALMLPF